MEMLRKLVVGLRAIARRGEAEREMDEELRAYVDAAAEAKMRAGMSRAEALRAARVEMGSAEAVKEGVREAGWESAVESLWRDIVYAWRMLRKSPGFTVAAVLTLALGLGANAAVFSVVNSVLIEPLRYPHPGRLVALHQTAPGAAGLANFSEGLRLSPSMYFTYSEGNRTFQSLGVWTSGTASVVGVGEPEQVRVAYVSDGVLESLDVAPLLGRWLLAPDQVPQGAGVVLLGYGYWRRRFGGDRSAIGRDLIVDSRARQIVGVMPEGFQIVDAKPDLILPFAFDRSKLILAGFGSDGLGRLKPGVSIAQADADLARLIPVWMRSWSNGPGTNPLSYESWRITPAIRSLKQEVVGGAGDVLWVVMATLGIVMLIACANVANLLLVRFEGRRRELAIRAVLGAPRTCIVRELLLECAILGMIGGALGLVIAQGGLRLFLAIGPANLPRLNEISLSGRSAEFTLALSLVSALFFGAVAVLRHARAGVAESLRGEGRGSSASREQDRARSVLVVVQVAMALVLLVGAGLMIRTFLKLRSVDPGFTNASHVQIMRISIPSLLVAKPQDVLRMQNDIVEKLKAIPGVVSAGFASEAPMQGIESNWDEIMAEGKTYPPGSIPPMYLYEYVSPDFFRTMGTRIVAGRELTWTDVYELRPVGLVSENLARELWGSPADAIGKRFREFPEQPWHRVVGVVQDVSEEGISKKQPEIVYWPSLSKNLFGPEPVDAPLNVIRTVTFVVRSQRAGERSFLAEIQRAVWSVNPNLPLASVGTMQGVYDRSLAQSSFALVMLAIAALMALALGIVGIYGVVSYVVAQRRREIGIRLALGAVPGDVARMVLRHGGKLAACGILLGLLASTGLTRLMATLLFGVGAEDPFTLVAVVVLLFGVVSLACYVPARRAMRVDPMAVLRNE